MPIYEYECQACGHRLEKIQKFSDDPLTDCPECGKADLRKLISAAAFQLKGSGWYVTDFRDKGKKSAKQETSASDKSDGGTAAKSDSSDKGGSGSSSKTSGEAG